MGGEFFAVPAAGPQIRYEALRAYLLDGEPAAAVAERFGYTPAGLHSAVADFRAGKAQAIGFLVGQVMKATGGKANPQLVQEVLRKALA